MLPEWRNNAEYLSGCQNRQRHYAGTRRRRHPLLRAADYESGVRIPPSETVVRMAEIYDAQYLCYQHLRQTSEIAQRLIPDVRECDLPEAVLRLIDQIYDFADAREDRRLITIAKDGVIDETERPEFDRIVSKLDEIVQSALAVAYNKGG